MINIADELAGHDGGYDQERAYARVAAIFDTTQRSPRSRSRRRRPGPATRWPRRWPRSASPRRPLTAADRMRCFDGTARRRPGIVERPRREGGHGLQDQVRGRKRRRQHHLAPSRVAREHLRGPAPPGGDDRRGRLLEAGQRFEHRPAVAHRHHDVHHDDTDGPGRQQLPRGVGVGRHGDLMAGGFEVPAPQEQGVRFVDHDQHQRHPPKVAPGPARSPTGPDTRVTTWAPATTSPTCDAGAGQPVEGVLRRRSEGHRHHHAEAQVEHPGHLVVAHGAGTLHLAEDPGHGPTPPRTDGAATGRKDPGQVARQSPTGDVGHGVDRGAEAGQQRHHGGGVDHRRLQQLLPERPRRARPGRCIQPPAPDAEQGGTSQGVPVAPQPGRQQPDQHIPGRHQGAVEQLVLLHDPHREADQVEVARRHDPGVGGQLATQDGAARLAAPEGDALHDLHDHRRRQLPMGLVVEEEQRRRPLAHQVVHAHGDQVEAHGVQPPDRLGHRQLGAHPVGGRHQDRLPVPRGDPEKAPEAADVAHHLRAVGRSDQFLHGLHGPVAGRDVDPRGGVGQGRARHFPICVLRHQLVRGRPWTGSRAPPRGSRRSGRRCRSRRRAPRSSLPGPPG